MMPPPIIPDGPITPPAGGGGGIVPDGPIQPPPEVSSAEALGRGALQGATFGFSDEITGAVESLLNPKKTYAQSRDESRLANKTAQEQHPFLYGGGELAGGLVTPVPGAGAIKGVGLGAKAAHAAIAGGLAGLGGSEADLTKGGFHQAVNDTISSALLGGAIGAVGGKIGEAVGKSGAKAEDQAIKALAGGESKTSGAAWQKTRRMVNNPETRSILHEDVTIEAPSGKATTTTLENAAGKPPDVIQEMVESQTKKIGEEIAPIYAKADAKNGGVKLSDYVKHLDEQLAATKSMAPAEAKVYRGALNELRSNAIEQWGHPDLGAALGSAEAREPSVQKAILSNFDTRIPSEDVRAEATALQKIGFKTVDPLNPGLSTQVKRDMGNMVRDFVNGHVMETLGGEDHSRLLSLNKRMNAWLGVGNVAQARAEKEAAGRMSLGGTASHLLGHGGALGAVAMAAHGNIPGAVAAYALPKALEHAPAASRVATRAVAKLDQRLKAIADQAAAGNPFAQKMLASIRGTPGGVARLAALEKQHQTPPSQPEPSIALPEPGP